MVRDNREQVKETVPEPVSRAMADIEGAGVEAPAGADTGTLRLSGAVRRLASIAFSMRLDSTEHKAENSVEQPEPPLLRNARIPWHDKKVQTDKYDRQYPEHIPLNR